MLLRPCRARGTAIALAVWTFIDALNPTFSTRWGSGNNPATNRTILVPQHKRVIIDGTTSINGNYYHVASVAAAKALTFTNGDWWLMPGGQTSTALFGELVDDAHNGFKGNSLSDMACWGTFDPADKENDAKYNTLFHTIDITGLGVDQQIAFCSRNVGMAFVTWQNLIFKTNDAGRGSSMSFGLQPNWHDWLIEACFFDHIYLYHQGVQASMVGGMASMPTTDSINDVTFKMCGSRYANGNGGAHNGAYFAAGVRRLRFERCFWHHCGWGDTQTRATPAHGDPGADDGPDIFKHNLYIDDYCDDVRLLDCVNSWDSANLKLTGGNYKLYNLVNVRDPIAFIYAANGNSAGVDLAFPSGSQIVVRNHLQLSSAEINTTTPNPAGWGPHIYMANSGSLYDKGMLLNIAGTNRQGFVTGANGSGIATSVVVSNSDFANWDTPDQTSEPNTTKTFTNNRWDGASVGSNSAWTDLSGAIQAKRTALLALNVADTFRVAYSIPTSTAGNEEARELRVMDYLFDHWLDRDWNYALHEHFRAALA